MSRVCLLVVVACSIGCGPEAAPVVSTPAPAPVPVVVAAPVKEVVVAPPVVEAPKAAPEPVDDGGPLGVAACDEYLAAYRACAAEDLVAISRAHHTQVIDGQRRAWKRAQADAELAGTLPEACASARAAAKLALPSCKKL